MPVGRGDVDRAGPEDVPRLGLPDGQPRALADQFLEHDRWAGVPVLHDGDGGPEVARQGVQDGRDGLKPPGGGRNHHDVVWHPGGNGLGLMALSSSNASVLPLSATCPMSGEERVEVDRLDQVMVEPRLARAAAGLLLPVARDGDDDGVLAALLSPQLGGHLVAVHPGKADVEEHDLGPMLAGRRRWRPGRYGRPGPSWPESFRSLAIPLAVSTLSSTTRTRKPRAGVASPALPIGVGPWAGRQGGGEPDDELAPLAGAVARRGDGAAVQLGERPDERQADAQPALRAGERAVGLGEEVEHPREQLRRDADPVVPHPEDDLVPLDPGDELDAAPGRRVLGGVGQEVDEDLLQPGRVGLEPQVRGREREQQLVLPLLDERPHGLDGVAETGPASTSSLWSWILPSVMRETSSRSSMRWAKLPDLPGGDVPAPFEVLLRARAGGERRRRSGWRRAGS